MHDALPHCCGCMRVVQALALGPDALKAPHCDSPSTPARLRVIGDSDTLSASDGEAEEDEGSRHGDRNSSSSGASSLCSERRVRLGHDTDADTDVLLFLEDRMFLPVEPLAMMEAYRRLCPAGGRVTLRQLAAELERTAMQEEQPGDRDGDSFTSGTASGTDLPPAPFERRWHQQAASIDTTHMESSQDTTPVLHAAVPPPPPPQLLIPPLTPSGGNTASAPTSSFTAAPHTSTPSHTSQHLAVVTTPLALPPPPPSAALPHASSLASTKQRPVQCVMLHHTHPAPAAAANQIAFQVS
jgi:hypothetical protein